MRKRKGIEKIEKAEKERKQKTRQELQKRRHESIGTFLQPNLTSQQNQSVPIESIAGTPLQQQNESLLSCQSTEVTTPNLTHSHMLLNDTTIPQNRHIQLQNTTTDVSITLSIKNNTVSNCSNPMTTIDTMIVPLQIVDSNTSATPLNVLISNQQNDNQTQFQHNRDRDSNNNSKQSHNNQSSFMQYLDIVIPLTIAVFIIAMIIGYFLGKYHRNKLNQAHINMHRISTNVNHMKPNVLMDHRTKQFEWNKQQQHKKIKESEECDGQISAAISQNIKTQAQFINLAIHNIVNDITSADTTTVEGEL